MGYQETNQYLKEFQHGLEQLAENILSQNVLSWKECKYILNELVPSLS